MNAAEAETIDKARKAAQEGAQKIKELITKADEIAQQQRELKVPEVQRNPENVKAHLDKITSVLDAFESKQVLSYSVQASPRVSKKPVVWIAVKNGPMTRITIESDNKVRVETVGMDGLKVTVSEPELNDLTEENMVTLIGTLVKHRIDPESRPGLWDALRKQP
jgi:hypothetical protein